jgi:hypothetical protein
LIRSIAVFSAFASSVAAAVPLTHCLCTTAEAVAAVAVADWYSQEPLLVLL